MLIWFVFILSFLMAVILSMTRPATSLYGSELGMSAAEIGVLVSVFALAPMLIALRAGKAADRFGDRIVIVVGFVIFALGLLLPWLLESRVSLYLAQTLVGVGQVIAATSQQNLVGSLSAVEVRDRNFAWFTTFVAAGFFVGPFVGGVIAQVQGQTAVFASASVLAFLSGLSAVVLPRHQRHAPPQNVSIGASIQLLKLGPIRRALVSGALILYSRDIFQSYFPLYGELLGLSPFEIGLVVSLLGGSMFVARILLPYALRYWDKELVLTGAIYLSGLAFLLIPLGWTTLIYLAAIAMGFGLGCGQPITMSAIFNASPPGRSGEVLGLRMTFMRLAQFVTPLFFGVVGSAIGLVGVFFINGAALLTGGYAVRRKRPPADGVGVRRID